MKRMLLILTLGGLSFLLTSFLLDSGIGFWGIMLISLAFGALLGLVSGLLGFYL